MPLNLKLCWYHRDQPDQKEIRVQLVRRGQRGLRVRWGFKANRVSRALPVRLDLRVRKECQEGKARRGRWDQWDQLDRRAHAARQDRLG